MQYELPYYGRLVRRFFMAGAILMLITLPFINPILPIPLFISLLAITILGIVAGLTSLYAKWSMIVDEVIAALAVIIFEYYAVTYYVEYSWNSSLFLINQLLALNFLIALYFATKNLRRLPTEEE